MINTERDTRARVTQELCAYLAALRFSEMPALAVHAGRRSVLDWLGCALAGSAHPSLDRLLAVLQEISGRPQATVFGRKLKLGLLEAPMANGQMGHVYDYDDTHNSLNDDDTHKWGAIMLHTSSPVLGALFALAQRDRVSGENFLLAYAVGFEAGVRSARASPGHFAGGWHPTGTLGSIAAAVAAGKLLDLDTQQITHAMAIGATQSAGMAQNRGTMCKSFHAGKAATNGVLAALLAQQGFDSSLEIMEGKRGFSRVYSEVARPEALTAGLGGDRWEIAFNGHKQYACGICTHAVIDALIAIRRRTPIDPAQVSAIELRVHRDVLTISGIAKPINGLQAKFSVHHSAAVALIDGAAGIAQFTDQRAVDPAVAALRPKVKVNIEESFRRNQAHACVVAGGIRYEAAVEHASGTVQNPMTDAAIEAKFLANAIPVIGSKRANRVSELVWKLDRLNDVGEIASFCG